MFHSTVRQLQLTAVYCIPHEGLSKRSCQAPDVEKGREILAAWFNQIQNRHVSEYCAVAHKGVQVLHIGQKSKQVCDQLAKYNLEYIQLYNQEKK